MQNQTETEKIPRSEEQGNDLESLDFPGKISAWKIKQEQSFSYEKTAKSQKNQGVQTVESLTTGSSKLTLLPTCCLLKAAQDYAGQ